MDNNNNNNANHNNDINRLVLPPLTPTSSSLQSYPHYLTEVSRYHNLKYAYVHDTVAMTYLAKALFNHPLITHLVLPQVAISSLAYPNTLIYSNTSLTFKSVQSPTHHTFSVAPGFPLPLLNKPLTFKSILTFFHLSNHTASYRTPLALPPYLDTSYVPYPNTPLTFKGILTSTHLSHSTIPSVTFPYILPVQTDRRCRGGPVFLSLHPSRLDLSRP